MRRRAVILVTVVTLRFAQGPQRPLVGVVPFEWALRKPTEAEMHCSKEESPPWTTEVL